MNNIEVKSQLVEVKASIDGKNLFVEGYAATFNIKDTYGDIIVPGAFVATLQNWKRFRLCYQHDMDDVVGKIIEMKEDAIGLWFKAKISNTTLGNDLRVLIEDEAINEISIGYKSKIAEWNETQDTRYLKEVELFEISFVSRAANPQAAVISTEVKSEKDKMTNMELVEKIEELKSELSRRIFLSIK